MSERATLEQAIKLLEYARDQQLSVSDLQAFGSSGLMSDFLMVNPRKVDRIDFQKFLGIRKVFECFVHRNDWSLAQLIEEAGYQKSDAERFLGVNFSHRTPFSRTQGLTQIHIVHFNRWLSLDQVLSKLSAWRLRPADLIEFLSFGVVARKEAVHYATLVALGSWLVHETKWPASKRVEYPMIYEYSGIRLGFSGSNSDGENRFGDHVCFAAVPMYV